MRTTDKTDVLAVMDSLSKAIEEAGTVGYSRMDQLLLRAELAKLNLLMAIMENTQGSC